ncbi:hypothetical protein [Gramella sp. AN32]|uniref:Uncharacterized protein n=1 Tax=Christiangramia antarctica TaxID=2058158 RepID=A0ABW5XAC2_9FLAO|nr:hypothetical protein [Gramella sp. AN32]
MIMCFSSEAQEQSVPKIGDELTIGNSMQFGYRHLDLPQANFIIKKYGRLNYDQLIGKSVVVTAVRSKKNNITVVLERADGKKFFGSFASIKADYQEALRSEELKKT